MMVVIECPHCNEDIEMDDDAFGLFSCPYCDNEYEWGEKPKSKIVKRRTSSVRRSKYESLVNKKSNPVSQKKSKSVSSTTYQKVLPNDEKLFTGMHLTLFFSTIFTLVVIILGLNSSSWYYADYGGDRDDGLSKFEINFSLTEMIIVIETVNLSDPNSFSGTDYDSQLADAEVQLGLMQERCSDSSNRPWGMNESEFPEWCSKSKSQIQKDIDWWSGWNAAGTAIQLFFIMGLVVGGLVIGLKMLALLNDYDILNPPPIITNNYYKIDSIASLLMVSFFLSGCLFFRLLVPDFEMFAMSAEPESKGLSLIWWFTIASLTFHGLLLFSELLTRKSNR